MSATESFIYFPALPPELRLQIWKEALSVRTIWAVVGTKKAVHYSGPRDLHMAFIGPAPYLAGLSCKEARLLLEETYGKPIRGPFSGSATNAASHWVDFNTTVIYFGNLPDVRPVLTSYGRDELSRFKHVALPWYRFGHLATAIRRVAKMCPALRTIIIQRLVAGKPTDHSVRNPLNAETAAYYANVPGNGESKSGDAEVDVSYLRSLLPKYFGSSPPSIHCLAPASITCTPRRGPRYRPACTVSESESDGYDEAGVE